MPTYYGGQAVIEGVMMRGQNNLAVAVRRRNGEIALDVRHLRFPYSKRIRNVPLLRGVFILIETLVLGIKILLYSADVSQDEREKVSPVLLWLMVPISFALAIGLFFILPFLLMRVSAFSVSSAIVKDLIEGGLRLAILLAYLWALGFLPEARRIFAYHGAEHKAINAYERGMPLEVGSVRAFSTAHPRCGTSFLLAVAILAILVFALLPEAGVGLEVLYRLVFIPLLAAMGFEVTRLSMVRPRHFLVRALLAPGLALQSLTTREPDDSQLEVAITALKAVVEADNHTAA